MDIIKAIIICHILMYVIVCSQPNNKFQISYNENGEIILVIDSQFHIDYGFSYPVTYKFQLLQHDSSMTAYKKYSKKDEWVKIVEKNHDDFFNGIESVRVDYNSNFVYLSVAFDSATDSIIIKLTNTIGNNVLFDFLEICKYYDNRQAVVSTTADDLGGLSIGFTKAFQAFRIRNLWLSCAAVTGRFNAESWLDIQKEIDSGLVEIDSHSRSHIHRDYDLEYEVVGSQDDIVNNLVLPVQYSNGNNEYVYAYIYPYGEWGAAIDETAGDAKYLICRTVSVNESKFTNWNNQYNLYDRVGVVYEIGPDYGGYGISDINLLNNTFDEVVEDGGIYHFSIHPNGIEDHGDWEKPYINEHLDYISNRKDIWYVGFGHLYLYHFLSDLVKEIPHLPLSIKIFLEGAYQTNSSMSNNLSFFIPKIQPFNNSPWNYKGNESVSIIPNNQVVDWVLVPLKNNSSDFGPVRRRAGFLKKDGYIVDLDGESPLRFSTETGSYYIQIEHRNHIKVMSLSPVLIIE